jgi:hypothetical protein
MFNMGELLEIEHRWAKAFQTMDRLTLDEILAPEFRLSFVTDPRAPKTVPREAWFSMLDRMSFGKYEILDHREVYFGEVGIISAHVVFHDWRLDGETLPSEFRITDVYIRREGRWQCANRISEPATLAPDFGEL